MTIRINGRQHRPSAAARVSKRAPSPRKGQSSVPAGKAKTKRSSKVVGLNRGSSKPQEAFLGSAEILRARLRFQSRARRRCVRGGTRAGQLRGVLLEKNIKKKDLLKKPASPSRKRAGSSSKGAASWERRPNSCIKAAFRLDEPEEGDGRPMGAGAR